MTGGWEFTAQSETDGWLLVPAGDAAECAAWAAGALADIRRALGEAGAAWNPDIAAYFAALLDAGVQARRSTDALTFLVWPAAAPACVIVHVSVVRFAAGDPRPGIGDGVLYRSAGLGPGIQIPVVESTGDGDLAGVRFAFCAADHAVVVDVEPTAPLLLAGVVESLHRFVDRLSVREPSGKRFRADSPALLETRGDADWADSVVR